MTICKATGHHCYCQPDEGMPCPHEQVKDTTMKTNTTQWLTDEQITAIWRKCDQPSEENNFVTGPLPFARAIEAAILATRQAAPVAGRQGGDATKADEALGEAVSAIYFNDNSKYEGALWNIVRHLAPSIVELLQSDPRAAYVAVAEHRCPCGFDRFGCDHYNRKGDCTYEPAAAHPPADASPAWDASATQRLRSIVDLLGMKSCMPDGDLSGYEFAVLGFVRMEIERLKSKADAAPVEAKPLAQIINAGGNTGSNLPRAEVIWFDGLPAIGTVLYAAQPSTAQGDAKSCAYPSCACIGGTTSTCAKAAQRDAVGQQAGDIKPWADRAAEQGADNDKKVMECMFGEIAELRAALAQRPTNAAQDGNVIGWYKDTKIDAHADSQNDLPPRWIDHRVIVEGSAKPSRDGWKPLVDASQRTSAAPEQKPIFYVRQFDIDAPIGTAILAYRNPGEEWTVPVFTQPTSAADSEDAARLEWLDKNAAYVGINPHAKTCLWVLRDVPEIPGKGFREAIDAARNKEAQKG